jgi:hypothetical protein
MEARLWTVHRKGDRPVRLVGDGFSFFALIVPPIWAIWHGAWLVLLGIVVLALAAAAYSPLAASPVMYGIGLILAFDGAELRRLDLRMRGWREAAAVEARTEEGAEELWFTGEPA